MLKNIIYKYRRFGAVEFFLAFKSAVIYYFVKNILKQKYLVRNIYDFKLKLDLNDSGISRQLVIGGTREEQLRCILKEEIQKGMTILDIGSNVGYYPIMEAKMVGESGYVYAVEPAPENYKNLIENIHLNNLSHIIETHNNGMSNKKGTERFFLSNHSNLHTFMAKGFKDNYITKGTSNNFIKVDVMDVSSFIKNMKSIDLVRMDVEGFEVEIIEGLEEAVKSGLFNGKIVFECHFPKYDDIKHSMRRQLEMLFKYNYRVKAMTSNNEATSKIKNFGYKAEKIICTSDNFYQGVYRDISKGDAIRLICELGGVRDVVLAT